MTTKRFKGEDRDQTRLLCVSLKDQLKPGSFEYAVDCVIDGLYGDDFLTERFCNDKTGCTAYLPKTLLKVVLVAYGRGIMGSRPIEHACRTDTIFMALTGELYPDHSTITKFVSELGPRLHEVFADVLMVCDDEDLLLGTRFALDGLKLPSNASKEWSGTFQQLRKKRDKLVRKVEVLAKEHKRVNNRLAKGKSAQCGPTAHEKLMKSIDKLSGFIETNKPRIGAEGKEVQSNITDNESCKMKTSHGTIQGFNAQALVNENQIIQYADIADSGQDGSVIKELMECAAATAEAAGLGKDYYNGKTLLADSNYHSRKNLEAAEAAGVDAIIPDNMFRSRDTRFDTREEHKSKVRKKKNLFTLKDFKYMEEGDYYTCPKGEALTLFARESKTGRGNLYRRYSIKKSNYACESCDFSKRCLSKKAKRKSLNIPVEGSSLTILQKMRERIDTPKAKLEYSKRMGIVEPVFGNIRHNKRLNRFNYRTREKVNWQWLLFCLVHNIEKIGRYGKSYVQTPI